MNIKGKLQRKGMRKKVHFVICILLLFCAFFFCPASSYAMEEHDYLKVGLKYGSTAVSECTLSSETGFQLYRITEGEMEESLPLPAYEQIIAKVEHGKIYLYDGEGTLLVAGLQENEYIMPFSGGEDSTLACDGTVYRGGVQFILNSNQKINVINYIAMDHYLYGVIHGEMSQSYPLEALKAQAVVARSFAELNVSVHKSQGFDLCTGTHCQVYKGYANEYPKTNQAVDETSGQMLYAADRVVAAYYHKNSGGHTQNSEDVWVAAEPYLRGVEDIYSPVYAWSATMTFDDLAGRLETWDYFPGDIRSVCVSKRNDAGAVSEFQIVGSEETIVLTKEKIRTVLGATAIKSTMFEISDQSKKAAESDSGAESEIYVQSGATAQKSKTPFYMISGDGKKKQAEETIYVSNGHMSLALKASSDSPKDTAKQNTVTGGTVYFSGKGYGHGIGMPQDSAIAMANLGFSYEEILKFFYTGIEIR